MSKTLQRRIIVLAGYILLGAIHYLIRGKIAEQAPVQIGDFWVLLIALAFAIITLLLEAVFYSKRGIFLYALVGLIAGFYSGDVLYKLFCMLFGNYCIPEIQPYFMLAFAYLGFFLPINATQKGGYAFQFPTGLPDSEKKATEIKLLDTSVIIDGRIFDIAETGFVSGSLVVPKFVLNEIQALADSQDPIKRSRARRGLDVLNKLKEITTVELRISSRDFPELRGVDTKLIQLAKEIHASILTNDYNLNKIAQLEGIQILNLNDLANAMKPLLLPGEEFEIDVIKEGKENNQGVGYLADGTMVVVASGLNQIGKKLMVRVTSILQTSAGRIIFTEPKDFKDLRK
ncbi:MAG: hypothetical protein A2Y33_05735 [Spirochaetes bacterium GWF1_51_8]|nr:MAG: hypothetical protein A2Y33_05735 [Spirochaetes bacterium GWF1_51_8]